MGLRELVPPRGFLERFDGLEPVSDQVFVVDRDRLTCSGGVSSAHLAASIVERHLGRALIRVFRAAEGTTPDAYRRT